MREKGGKIHPTATTLIEVDAKLGSRNVSLAPRLLLSLHILHDSPLLFQFDPYGCKRVLDARENHE